jgi:hypothetical protein
VYPFHPASLPVTTTRIKEAFNWDEFKERFTNDFGKVEEKRYSLEQLLEYANRKFGKTLEDLILQNQIYSVPKVQPNYPETPERETIKHTLISSL